MNFLADLVAQGAMRFANQNNQPRAPRQDTSGYQPRQGGAMVYGATLPQGQRFQEDDFTFPQGGQFRRNPNGSTYLDGAFVPQGLGLQEDSFTFSQPQGIRTQQQIQQAPFRMYEDGSFQGNPQQYQQRNPQARFYEDNTFQDPLAELRRFLGF